MPLCAHLAPPLTRAPASMTDDGASSTAEPAGADSPAPPAHAAAWRHRTFALLHTRRAHVTHLAVILLDIALNIAGLLLALFTCRTPREHLAESVKRAEEALRWSSVGLLSLMILELLARAAAVGPLRFFRVPLHALDAAALGGLLGVEAGVSDEAADAAAGLLVVVRVARMLRLLSSLHDYAADERRAAEARAKHAEARADRAEAALRAAQARLAALQLSPTDGPGSAFQRRPLSE